MDNKLPLIEARLISTFVAIAETGSLQKASKRIGKAKSTLSRWLAELEDILGYQVFDRKSSGLVLELNEQGKALLSKAKSVLATMGRFEDFAFAQDDALTPSKVSLCFNQLIENKCIVELIVNLREIAPQTEISVMQCMPDQVQQLLQKNSVDFVLGFTTELIYPDIGGLIVGQEQVMMVAHPSHPLVGNEVIDSQQLLPHTVIVPEFVQSKGYRDSFQPIVSITTPDFQLALALAIEDMGIAYIPEHIARPAIHNKQVFQLPINWDEFSQQVPLMLYFRLDYAYPSIKQQLLEGLREWFGYQEG
ncbi:MAG: LysR family transcriptional regulator [Psychromonas sp.]